MERDGYRLQLEYRRDMTREELNSLSGGIFDAGRTPTDPEFDRLGLLQERIDGYNRILIKFFQPPREPEPEFEGPLY